MRTEAVRAQLAAHGLGDRYREFTVSSATVALAAEALHIMEKHQPHPITVLPVCDEAGKAIGMVHITDLLRQGVM